MKNWATWKSTPLRPHDHTQTQDWPEQLGTPAKCVSSKSGLAPDFCAYSDTNPTSLGHPANDGLFTILLTQRSGAKWTTNAPIQSSFINCVVECGGAALLSITVRNGDTNGKDVNGSCDNGTHHATLAHKNSVGDEKPRQVVKTTHAVSKHERHKDPCKPSEHDEKTCQNKYISVKGKWTRCTRIVQRKSTQH